MYRIYLLDWKETPLSSTYSKEKLYIYDPITHDDGYAMTEPTVDIEASKTYTFTCTLYPTNYGFDKIEKGITRLVVEKDSKVKFMGKITSSDNDIYNNLRIEATGVLDYLNDTLTIKKVLTNDDFDGGLTLTNLLSYIFGAHNERFSEEPWKRFVLVHCSADFVGRNSLDVNSNTLSAYSINFDKPLELVQELVDLADAAFKIEYSEENGDWEVYVYPKDNFPTNNNQPIEIGLNLTEISTTNEYNDVCSVVAPFGGDLIQESKDIGDAVAGKNINTTTTGGDVIAEWYADAISVHNPNAVDPDDPWYYQRYAAVDAGYWVFGLYIDNYNSEHPDTPLKKLYISWRGYKFTTNAGEYAPEGWVEDCAWRIYDANGYTLGYHEFSENGFDGEINEEIDLTQGEYFGASHIVVSGWGGAITPLIRRDATIIDDNDKVNLQKCDIFEHEDGFTHEANSYYLISDTLLEKYGRIERKLEYDIEDSTRPVSSDIWYLPYSANGHDDFDFETTGDGPLGAAKEYDGYALGYIIGGHSDEPDFELNKGNYQIVPFGGTGSGYKCIQYRLPSLGNKDRPRGVYISCRMHVYGEYDDGTTKYQVEGMYAVYDDAWQVLTYKSAEEPKMGKGFTTIVDEYIDLSDAKYYGAKYIRVCNFKGHDTDVEIKCVPSDDAYARNRLMDQAKLYLKNLQTEKNVIEATAIDLNVTDEQWEEFDICTNVIAPGLQGRMQWYPISSLSIQLDDFSNNRIKLGFDEEEYLSKQLAKEQRITSILQTQEERRTSNASVNRQ